MKLLTFMAPVILCAAISFQALVVTASKKGVPWSQPLFYAFLPGCFLMMVGVMLRMSRDTSRLRRRIARLEKKLAQDSPPGEPGDSGRVAAEDGAMDSPSHEG